MPQQTSPSDSHLISVLKEYWRNHKFHYSDRLQAFIQTFAGYQGYIEDLQTWYFKDDSYYPKLALSIAKAVCLSSHGAWELMLIRHGFNRKKDTSFYLRAVVNDLRELGERCDLEATNPRYLDRQQLPEKLREAIAVVTSQDSAMVRDARMEQLAIPLMRAMERERERPRSVLA